MVNSEQEIDTSRYTIKGVLFQEQEGKWKPITFLSRIIYVMGHFEH